MPILFSKWKAEWSSMCVCAEPMQVRHAGVCHIQRSWSQPLQEEEALSIHQAAHFASWTACGSSMGILSGSLHRPRLTLPHTSTPIPTLTSTSQSPLPPATHSVAISSTFTVLHASEPVVIHYDTDHLHMYSHSYVASSLDSCIT